MVLNEKQLNNYQGLKKVVSENKSSKIYNSIHYKRQMFSCTNHDGHGLIS